MRRHSVGDVCKQLLPFRKAAREQLSLASVQTSRLTSSEYCGCWIENCLVFWFSRKHHKSRAEQCGQICHQKWQSIVVSKNVHKSPISYFFRERTLLLKLKLQIRRNSVIETSWRSTHSNFYCVMVVFVVFSQGLRFYFSKHVFTAFRL